MPAQQEPYPLERLPLAKVSCLALLALPPGDLDELRRQGFVSREMRGGRTRFRLRYRRRGRQVALDLGSQPWLAAGCRPRTGRVAGRLSSAAQA